MNMFGAKLGFALRFDLFKTPVPPEGGVLPMWFSNVPAIKGELPMKLIDLLPEPRGRACDLGIDRYS
jgi:hypothetical protein